MIASNSNSKQFVAQCGSICYECTNSSHCLSCYSNSAVNNLSKLDSTTSSCVAGCASNQFEMSSICYACDTVCASCSVISSNCTSCPGGEFLLEGSCLSSCPSGYYTSGSNCLGCVSPCSTCTSSAQCLSCVNGNLLQNDNSCANSCPSGQYNRSNNCVNCFVNCSSCDVNGCLTCESGFILISLNLKICLNDCMTGYYVDSTSTLCEQCQSPCLTCHNSSTNCTSCDQLSTLKYLSAGECLGSCPTTSYPSEDNVCQSCVYPCIECLSDMNCTVCAASYYLYTPTSQCVQTCIGNTIIVGLECHQCVSPCLICSGITSSCVQCV